MLTDPYGRTIEYLRISVTDRCNLRCRYCMPPGGIELKDHDEILPYERIADVAAAAASLGIRKIRLTGGEPLVRKDVHVLVSMLRRIEGIEEIAMTTNGILLTPRAARILKEAGLDRLNISLDTLDPVRYGDLTRGGNLGDVLAGIEAAAGAGFTGTKINMVVLESTTAEEVEEMERFCGRRGLKLQRIRHFTLDDRGDALLQDPVCDRPLPCTECNRLRLTADGKLKPCLFSDVEIEVDPVDPEGSIVEAVSAKPETGESCTGRNMREIGG